MTWLCLYPTEDDQTAHFIPDFGREHELTQACWCWPDACDGVLVHNVEM